MSVAVGGYESLALRGLSCLEEKSCRPKAELSARKKIEPIDVPLNETSHGPRPSPIPAWLMNSVAETAGPSRT